MKSTIQFLFIAFLLICAGCKKHNNYHIKYTTDIYLPQVFKSNCGKLFDRPDIAISLDTFNFHSYMSARHPLYAYCKDNNKIDQFFGPNLNDRSPFYIGNVNAGGVKLELFTFNGFLGKYNQWVTGYFSLKQPGGYEVFKTYEANTGNPTTLQPRMRDNYLLLWEETYRVPDSVNVSKPKTIEVQYCVLKIMKNSTITVLAKQEGEKLIKEDFFRDLPPSGSITF